MKALVLCGGFGTRLGSLTKEIPKVLLPIGRQPLLDYTLRYLARYNFANVALNLHYRGEDIAAFVGNGAKWGISLTTVFEPRLLGTAGAVKNLESFFASEASFLVMYGDLLIDQDLGLLWSEHLNNKALATVLIHRRKGSNSIVSLDDSFRITSFVERPHHSAALADEHWVNSGVYAFSREILDFIPADSACDFPRDIFPKLLAADKVLKGFPLTGYRCAIDSPERYQQACQAFAAGKVTVAG